MALKNNQNRTIVLPISETIYNLFINDNDFAHKTIINYIEQIPECFPKSIINGYVFNGKTRKSKKVNLKMRKIKTDNISYRIRPSFILPYQRGRTDEVANALFLMRFGVPFWAIAFVFGRNSMWWYRLFLSFSDYSIVGTTIRDPNKLPQDILADEHHIKIRGKKAYIATTAGSNCFLGMSACNNADEYSLMNAYAGFKEESQNLKPDYQPDTVNTDGWWATQNAWKLLYPTIAVIECFLHAFIKVRDRATKKLKQHFNIAGDKIWNCYNADSKKALAQQIRRLREWTHQLDDSPMKNNILKLCKKKKRWMQHFDAPNAHRTSNMIDRLMRAMNRHAYNSQMFHGKKIESTSKNFRAFALLYNFSPSSPAARIKDKALDSPAARLNGFTYHQNWLHNLLISSSLHGFRHHRNPL